MFAFVRFLLLAVILLAVFLFLQPNLLKELGLKLPDEETAVTTETGAAQQPDETVEATEPVQEEITPPSTMSDPQETGETPVMQESTAETAPVAEPEATTETADQAPVGSEAVAPAEESSVEEQGYPAAEPVPDIESPQQTPEATEPASETNTSETPASHGEQTTSEQPASGPAIEEQSTSPAATEEELPLLPEMPPPFAEGTELPVTPATAEEPASTLPVETIEEEASPADSTPDSLRGESGDDELPPADQATPDESAGEAEEIPTAGSPELQRVLENIDRTFNN